MATPKQLYYEKRGKILVKNLQSRHFDAYYCANKEEALKKALELIPEGSSVGWGGAHTCEEIGLMAPATVQSQYLEGQSYLDCSQETSARIDQAVQKLINGCYDASMRLLAENRALLDEIAQYLLVKETITGEELMNFVNAPKEAEVTAEETEN